MNRKLLSQNQTHIRHSDKITHISHLRPEHQTIKPDFVGNKLYEPGELRHYHRSAAFLLHEHPPSSRRLDLLQSLQILRAVDCFYYCILEVLILCRPPPQRET